MIEYKYDGKYLRQRGAKAGEVDKTTIRDAHGRRVARIDGKVIRDARGNPLAEFDGKCLRNPSGQKIATVDQMHRQLEGAKGITLAALWLSFIRTEDAED